MSMFVTFDFFIDFLEKEQKIPRTKQILFEVVILLRCNGAKKTFSNGQIPIIN